MDREELVNVLAERLIWDVIGAYIEESKPLSIMLKDIYYLKDKDDFIRRTNFCEITVPDEFNVMGFSVEKDKILIEFEYPFVMTAFSEEDALLRITACAEGSCEVPDINAFDWSKLDFDNMDREELLSYKDLVENIELHYVQVECDDISIY